MSSSTRVQKGDDPMPALFGPAGNADAFPYKSSVDAPRWLAERQGGQRGRGHRPQAGPGRRGARHPPVPPRPLLHQPGQPRSGQPEKDRGLHPGRLPGGRLDGGHPGGGPHRGPHGPPPAGGPGDRQGGPAGPAGRLRHRRPGPYRPVSRDHGQDQSAGRSEGRPWTSPWPPCRRS